jgi:hypothetical protein
MVSGMLRITPKHVRSHPVAVMRWKMPLTSCEMAIGAGGHSPLKGMDAPGAVVGPVGGVLGVCAASWCVEVAPAADS